MWMWSVNLLVLNLNESYYIRIAVVPLMIVLRVWKVVTRQIWIDHVFLTIENSQIYLFYSKNQLFNKYLYLLVLIELLESGKNIL